MHKLCDRSAALSVWSKRALSARDDVRSRAARLRALRARRQGELRTDVESLAARRGARWVDGSAHLRPDQLNRE